MLEYVLDLSGIENVYPQSPHVADLSAQALLNNFADRSTAGLRSALSRYTGFSSDHIFISAGDDEILMRLLRAVAREGEYLAIPEAASSTVRFHAGARGLGVIDTKCDSHFRVHADLLYTMASNPEVPVVYLANPSNPTGTLVSPRTVERVLKAGKTTVVDETYFEFSRQSCLDLLRRYPNLVVLRGFKWAALSGVKIAYAVTCPETVERLSNVKGDTESLTPMAVAAAAASLEERTHLIENVRRLVFERERLFSVLREIPDVTPFASETNFLFCRFPGQNGRAVASSLFRNGVKVRHYADSVFRDGIRVRVGYPEHSEIFLAALKAVLNGHESLVGGR